MYQIHKDTYSKQHAKNVMTNNLGLNDFALGLVNSVIHLHSGQDLSDLILT